GHGTMFRSNIGSKDGLAKARSTPHPRFFSLWFTKIRTFPRRYVRCGLPWPLQGRNHAPATRDRRSQNAVRYECLAESFRRIGKVKRKACHLYKEQVKPARPHVFEIRSRCSEASGSQ